MPKEKVTTMTYREVIDDGVQPVPEKKSSIMPSVILVIFCIIGYVAYDKNKDDPFFSGVPDNGTKVAAANVTVSNSKGFAGRSGRDTNSIERETDSDDGEKVATYTVYRKWQDGDSGIYELEDTNGNIRRVSKKFFKEARVGCIYKE